MFILNMLYAEMSLDGTILVWENGEEFWHRDSASVTDANDDFLMGPEGPGVPGGGGGEEGSRGGGEGENPENSFRRFVISCLKGGGEPAGPRGQGGKEEGRTL